MGRRWLGRPVNKDKKHAVVVAALRAVGARVYSWDAPGAPDLVVGHRGRTWLVEVKSPLGKKGGSSKDGQKLSEKQAVFHATWTGGPISVVRTPEEAVQLVLQRGDAKHEVPSADVEATMGRAGGARQEDD